MQRYFLSIKAFCLLAMVLPLMLLASGCGGSDDSATGATVGQITVETGSLSKEEFIKEADLICRTSRSEFDRAYNSLGQQAPIDGSEQSLEVLIGKVVDNILLPIYQKEIDQISALGAPSGDEDAIASFLNALELRLNAMQKEPTELGKSLTPFARPEKMAKGYGLTGCAESFS